MDIPKRIIEEVASKMLDNRIELEDIAIVPNVFVIYVHRDNYADIRSLLKILRAQIIVRLTKEITKRDKKDIKDIGKFNKVFEVVLGINVFGGNKKIIVPGEWDISFEKTEREVLVGDEIFEIRKDEICVVASYSEAGPEENDLASHLKTFVTIFKTDDNRSENFLIETAPVSMHYSQADKNPEKNTAPLNNILARLSYKYENTEKAETIEMTKDKILVGRDPAGDLVLQNASNRISRKHLEITYKNNRFYLRSFGAYGTTLQGRSVPKSEKDVGDGSRDQNNEIEIPDKARIGLAGGEVLIDFIRTIK